MSEDELADQNSTTKSLSQLFGIFAIIISLGLLGHMLYGYFSFQWASPAEKLQVLWEKDTEKLLESKILPPQWSDIKEIELFAGTKSAKEWLPQLITPIRLKNDGNYKLEILLLSWREGDILGAVVQYNLVNLKNGNMEWELGRTYILRGQKKAQSLVVDEVPEAAKQQIQQRKEENKSN